jgi:NAD(P)-dependent dehydrogenase (short-subunit alcohol dehydrogenase family)
MMSLELFSLKDRVALVAGGSRGLGKAMAESLAGAGADIALASRNAARLEETASELRQRSGRRVHAIAVDITERERVEAMVLETLGVLGKIDILVNSVGTNIRKPVQEFSEREWHEVIDTNLTATFLCCQAVGPHMVERGFGRVINIGSILASFGLAERTAYTASKGGVIQLTRTLALEWAPHHVTVNAICPGFFATELNEPIIKNRTIYKQLCEKIPLGRFADPAEIQTAALFLASPASSYVTGSILYIDGGVTAGI